MGKYFVDIAPGARKELQKHYKSGDKASIKKIERILSELQETPYSGTGQPEQLKYELTGYWSRRINLKDRIIYRVAETIVTVFVVSAIGHYSEK